MTISTTFNHLTLTGEATLPQHAITKAELEAKITALIGTAPGALDTLQEIAAALSNDENAYVTLSTMISNASTANTSSVTAEATRATAAEVKEVADRIAADVVVTGLVTTETNRATTEEGVLAQRLTDAESSVSQEVDERVEAVNGLQSSLDDEVKNRGDRDIELTDSIDLKANLEGAVFSGSVTHNSHLYIGEFWRIVGSDYDLSFEHSRDGETWSVGVPFISAE